MHYSTLALFILAPIAFAIPNPAPVLELVYTDNGITSGTSDPANDKRDLIYTDGGITTPGDSDLSKRRSNYVSSCGPNWMKIYDDPAGKWQGYASAVKTFCFRQTHNGDEKPLILSSSQASSASISGGLQLTSGNPARVDYGPHTVVEADCVTSLMKMTAPGNTCYGKKNVDTKGGTWQVDSNKISYHALPKVQY